MARKLNALLIYHSRQFRRQFEALSKKLKYPIYMAEGRAEGLAVMYKLHPDLIFLETIVDQPESWQILSIIRLFTDIPVLLVADRLPDAHQRPLLAGNSIVLVRPISPRKIASAMRVVLTASGSLRRATASIDIATSDLLPGEPIERLTWLAGFVSKARGADPAQALDQGLMDRLLVLLNADWVGLYRMRRATPVHVPDLESRCAGTALWDEDQVQFVTHRVLEVVRTQNLIVRNEPALSDGVDASGEGIGPLAVAPLVGRTRVHGALCVTTRGSAGEGFTVPQIQFITAVSETLALTLDNALLAQENRESAIWDGTTGIHSTAFGDHAIEFEKHRASRYGSKFSVVQLEWMNGQEYRDARGNEDYERVLRDIAHMSKKSVRASDVVAYTREGRISFVLPMTDPAAAQHVVERLNNTLRASFAEYAPDARPIVAAQVMREEAAA